MPTFSFNVDAITATRIAVAIGNRRQFLDGAGNPRTATAAEIKQFIITFLQGQVRDAETSIERQKIAVEDITIT